MTATQDPAEHIAALDAEILLVEAELHRVQHKLVALKRRRNAAQPIADLPPEILHTIFHLLQRDDSVEPYYPFPATDPAHRQPHTNIVPASPGWHRAATHVSAHWRAVALAFPDLWNRMAFGDPSWMETVLSRSESLPISFFVGSAKCDGVRQFLEVNGDRVVRLKLALPQRDYLPIVNDVWKYPLNGLHELDLNINLGLNIDPFPLGLLQCSASSLQHLKLTFIGRLEWDFASGQTAICLPNLRSLYTIAEPL